jgi:general secretion pathway protein K
MPYLPSAPRWRHPDLRPHQARQSKPQRGAALLSAMLVVSLVASMSVAANWQVWRALELETAERSRQQAVWLLNGALDWARLILREDARANQGNAVDHLSEPWALPLAESKLASFLDEQRDALSDDDRNFDAYLSGQISDLQGRLNVSNLIAPDGKLSPKAWTQWQALYAALQLPATELNAWVPALLQAHKAAQAANAAMVDSPASQAIALKPQSTAQLRWLGLSERSAVVLQAHISLLPQRTAINLNTASIEVLQAVFPGLDRVGAQQLVLTRSRAHYPDLIAAQKRLPFGNQAPDAADFSVSSQYFEIRGRLRIQGLGIEERSVVWRNGNEMRVLLRERGLAI